MVFSACGGMGAEASVVVKKLASSLSAKRNEAYSRIVAWMRCCLSFTLARSAIRCIRGSRSLRRQPLEPPSMAIGPCSRGGQFWSPVTLFYISFPVHVMFFLSYSLYICSSWSSSIASVVALASAVAPFSVCVVFWQYTLYVDHGHRQSIGKHVHFFSDKTYRTWHKIGYYVPIFPPGALFCLFFGSFF